MEFARQQLTRRTISADRGLNRGLALVEPSSGRPEMRSKSVVPGFSATEMHHNFAIWRLTTGPSSSRYTELYVCLRCKWAFTVDTCLEHVTPMDDNREPLVGVAAAERLATFSSGPCPVFMRPTEDAHPTQRFSRIDSLQARLIALIVIYQALRSRVSGVGSTVDPNHGSHNQ